MGKRRLSDKLRHASFNPVELLKPVSMGPELVNSPNVLKAQYFPGEGG
jgi:hypothetical protein